jgi:ribosomal protein S21
MIQVTRKDGKESTENLLRRFNRKVSQSGIVAEVRHGEYFASPDSKRDRRRKAIVRDQRKAEKARRIKLGLK